MTENSVRLAFSPDSDDIFMFWALLNGRVGAGGATFEAERADTETLNARAERGDVDVVAVSIAQYARVLVANEARDLASLAGKRIGVPGLRTTAYLVLRLLLPDFEGVVVPIAPYSAAFSALRDGEIDLDIHFFQVLLDGDKIHIFQNLHLADVMIGNHTLDSAGEPPPAAAGGAKDGDDAKLSAKSRQPGHQILLPEKGDPHAT